MNETRFPLQSFFHPTFCSPFSFSTLQLNFLWPRSHHHSLPTHLPQLALKFLLHMFNLSWSTHISPSAWKQSIIIPSPKSGKPTDSFSSYRPTSLTFCTYKLFERMVLGQFTFFLESNTVFTPMQAGFRPGRLIINQVLFFSQSIAGFFY